jgi:hypothetical protein
MAYPLFHPEGTAVLPMTMTREDFVATFAAETELLEFN